MITALQSRSSVEEPVAVRDPKPTVSERGHFVGLLPVHMWKKDLAAKVARGEIFRKADLIHSFNNSRWGVSLW